MKRLVACALIATMCAPAAAFAQDDDEGDDRSATERPDTQEDVDVGALAARVPPHRYAYAGAGVFLLGGLGLSYWAQGEAARAGTVTTARDSQATLNSARQSAATANLMYAMAGLTLAYGLVMEFLPPQVAQKAGLTFHF